MDLLYTSIDADATDNATDATEATDDTGVTDGYGGSLVQNWPVIGLRARDWMVMKFMSFYYCPAST